MTKLKKYVPKGGTVQSGFTNFLSDVSDMWPLSGKLQVLTYYGPELSFIGTKK